MLRGSAVLSSGINEVGGMSMSPRVPLCHADETGRGHCMNEIAVHDAWRSVLEWSTLSINLRAARSGLLSHNTAAHSLWTISVLRVPPLLVDLDPAPQ